MKWNDYFTSDVPSYSYVNKPESKDTCAISQNTHIIHSVFQGYNNGILLIEQKNSDIFIDSTLISECSSTTGCPLEAIFSKSFLCFAVCFADCAGTINGNAAYIEGPSSNEGFITFVLTSLSRCAPSKTSTVHAVHILYGIQRIINVNSSHSYAEREPSFTHRNTQFGFDIFFNVANNLCSAMVLYCPDSEIEVDKMNVVNNTIEREYDGYYGIIKFWGGKHKISSSVVLDNTYCSLVIFCTDGTELFLIGCKIQGTKNQISGNVTIVAGKDDMDEISMTLFATAGIRAKLPFKKCQKLRLVPNTNRIIVTVCIALYIWSKFEW